ncbi:hypothetical protein [Cytobacillus firmus]|uniref:hypothetical protein n=1 Tax=Cytobacillus firmus TaxID=1399 RepID=UPI001CFD7BCC|nr:hypothetical protein [Cytobacillus firmus]
MKKIFIDEQAKTLVIEDQHGCFEIPVNGEVSALLKNEDVIKLLNMIEVKTYFLKAC